MSESRGESRRADCCCFALLGEEWKDVVAKKGLYPQLTGVKNICFLLTRCCSGVFEDWEGCLPYQSRRLPRGQGEPSRVLLGTVGPNLMGETRAGGGVGISEEPTIFSSKQKSWSYPAASPRKHWCQSHWWWRVGYSCYKRLQVTKCQCWQIYSLLQEKDKMQHQH